MQRLALISVMVFLVSPAFAQDDKKAAEKKPEAPPPQLKTQERAVAKAAAIPAEDGKEKSYEMLEKQGWVYLFDGRIPKDPKASDPLGLWRFREANDPKRNLWSVIEENGERVLRNTVGKDAHGTDLISKQNFWDFDVHVEFRVPEGSNSGVYLRGRYEIQIDGFSADKSKKPGANNLGAIYNVREPIVNASRGPGQWQVLEATIRSFRVLNVRLNGDVIHANVEIPEAKKKGTGSELGAGDGASEDVEAPGPIFLQGDHGSIDFRNVRVRPHPAPVRRTGPERERVFDLKNDTRDPKDLKDLKGGPEVKKAK